MKVDSCPKFCKNVQRSEYLGLSSKEKEKGEKQLSNMCSFYFIFVYSILLHFFFNFENMIIIQYTTTKKLFQIKTQLLDLEGKICIEVYLLKYYIIENKLQSIKYHGALHRYNWCMPQGRNFMRNLCDAAYISCEVA